MQAGQFALCGHKTLVLSALWRSLGGDVRQIRFTQNDDIACSILVIRGCRVCRARMHLSAIQYAQAPSQ